MNDRQRFRLHFGPYRTPRFRYGAIVWDEVRGNVRIVGMSDALIPWPLGRPPGARGRASLIVYRGLVKAVKREANQAVAHWWGITGQTVTKWGRVLGISATTPGTSKLRSAHARTPSVRRGLRKAHAQSRDPANDAGRRAKIGAAHRGKKKPPHVVAAVSEALRGRRLSKATRRKMSEAHRRRGTRPAGLPPLWLRVEDELLRTLPPLEVASRTGRTLGAVYARRSRLGVPDGRSRKTRSARGSV